MSQGHFPEASQGLDHRLSVAGAAGLGDGAGPSRHSLTRLRNRNVAQSLELDHNLRCGFSNQQTSPAAATPLLASLHLRLISKMDL